MKISQLLQLQHAESGAHSHKDVRKDILGDGYLMNHNFVYRNINQFALKIGCEYRPADSQYLLMPFQSLKDIVDKKRIPYIPSVSLLQILEDRAPDALAVDDVTIPESYHLHEAAHVIAESFFVGTPVSSQPQKILKAIICESFANTVDALANVSASDELHQFYLRYNCYMRPQKKNIDRMNRLLKVFGPKFTFICILVAYVHANFLREMIAPAVFVDLASRFAPEVQVTEKLLKDFDGIRQMAEQLDPLFRVQTTQMYFKLEGFGADIYELLDFDFVETLYKSPGFLSAIEGMGGVVMGLDF